MKTCRVLFWLCALAVAAAALAVPRSICADDPAPPKAAPQETPAAEAAESEKAWTVDFDAAKKIAAKDGKDIFMEFTGSDWCPPCKALHKNVLSKDAFVQAATRNFVLLKLDYPNDKSKQTEEEIKQNEQLNNDYNIDGFPTVILADAKGRPYVKMVGYDGDEADVFIKRLAQQQKLRVTRDEAFAKAEKAEGIAKAKLLDEAVSGIDLEVVLDTYKTTVEEILALDGDGKAGLKAKYEGKIKQARAKARLVEIVQGAGDDPAAALKQIDDLISEFMLAGEAMQEALYYKGVLLYSTDKAASKRTLEAAMKLAPNSDLGKQIERILKDAFQDADNE